MSTLPADVCVLGSLNLDLVARVERLPGPGETVLGRDFQEHPGGKGANQAVAAARAGARTVMIGAVGDDDAGRRLRKVIEAEGIDATAVATVEAPTGRALIGVDDRGENSIMVIPGANGALTPTMVRNAVSVLRGARVLLMHLDVPLDVIEAACQLADPTTLVVLNPAPAAVLPSRVLHRVDVLIPNEHELAQLGGAQQVLAAGVTRLLVTEGARGALLLDALGHSERIRPWPVTPVDTTAAGDAFCGVFAASLSKGRTWSEAAQRGALGGALATTRPGAIASLPYDHELQGIINDEK
jgi:ribokinase